MDNNTQLAIDIFGEDVVLHSQILVEASGSDEALHHCKCIGDDEHASCIKMLYFDFR